MAALTDHKDNKDQAAAFSLQSRWLQSTLSDLEKKKECMLIIMQDDEDSFVKRAEMYYKKRPKLVDALEDLCKSYRSLSEIMTS